MHTRNVLRILLVFLGVFLMADLPVVGQVSPRRKVNRVPIYRSQEDSIRLKDIERQINDLREITTVNSKKLDSLLNLYQEQQKAGITGFRNIYSPSEDHISFDSLLKITDLSRVKRVSIHNLPLRVLPPVLYECSHLESLEIINTQIRCLPESLNRLTHLKTVRIYNPASRRRLRLEKNHHISNLVIRSDEPGVLPRSYRHLRALQLLDLSGNNLRRFPNGARRNKALRELILQNNRITLKNRIKKHHYLETLGLRHNEIVQVPKSIRNMRSLKKLNFNYNQINRVHVAIRDLKNLEDLSFYRNELTHVPEGIYEMTHLREIDLFYNRIDGVDSRIGGLKELKMLYLSHNMLSSLPEAVGELTALEGLYVWDNLLEYLPSDIGKLQNLRFLWVNNNRLSALPDGVYSLSRLEELDISHNQIRSVRESIFDFPLLKILSLVDNPWNENIRSILHKRGAELIARNVYVHLPE